ncbi:hypothetical protein LshimejAT787_1500720 [Lyophyllum shimeji]|uniref:Uncharacterized protein n=1 Tax=Lyophyllum shimeji TaxID=47721 RepID=A0A9P3PXN0_LYOSH|nr:hypothetical protein LshimejAT787_1500720 [Lyophyllum shimeji]
MLHDIPTLTELAVMTLYSQAVTHPYMRTVRGPRSKNINILDLGDFHTKVKTFCQTIIEQPEYLASSDATPELGSLDGQDWERPEAIDAVKQLIPRLPDLSECLVAFFTGALRTWIRFTAEFAPGGVIDLSTVKERELAWMPPTSDANEGILGSFRVGMRDTPTMTQHQWNAQATFQYNGTQAFMDAAFDGLDHVYLMRMAQKWDASGMETKRRKAQVKFDLRVAQMQREKDAMKRQREISTLTAYLDVVLFSSETDLEAKGITARKIDEQLDLLQNFGGDNQLPKTKKARGLKPEKVKLLREALLHYEKRVSDGGETIFHAIRRRLTVLESENMEVVADWCDEEEEEMGDEN